MTNKSIQKTIQRDLFQHNFPSCKTNKGLIELQEKNSHLDRYYIASLVSNDRRVLFEDCYKIYEPYKDSNFLTEIPTRFHQRTWEMYLGTLFVKNGKLLKKDRGDSQADLQVLTPNLIHIECTAVTHGDPTNPDSVPKMRFATDIDHLFVDDVPEDKILLRITQALNDKRKQYTARISDKRVSEKDPYIIAINTGEMGYPEHLPRILKAVFGVGYLTLRMRENGLPIANPSSFWSRRETISKVNKTDVDMTFFEKEENRGISAVIYSNVDVLNHLMGHQNDLILVHNPLATNPISLSEFGFLTQHYVDKSTGNVEKIEAKL